MHIFLVIIFTYLLNLLSFSLHRFPIFLIFCFCESALVSVIAERTCCFKRVLANELYCIFYKCGFVDAHFFVDLVRIIKTCLEFVVLSG